MSVAQGLAYLDREEWNAAYFLGLEEVVRRGLVCDFAGQLEAGVKRLSESGYRFSGASLRTSVRRGGWSRTGWTEQERSCRELAAGVFDTVGRARQTLRWLADQVPGLDTGWLHGVVACYDEAHGQGVLGHAPKRKAPSAPGWLRPDPIGRESSAFVTGDGARANDFGAPRREGHGQDACNPPTD